MFPLTIFIRVLIFARNVERETEIEIKYEKSMNHLAPWQFMFYLVLLQGQNQTIIPNDANEYELVQIPVLVGIGYNSIYYSRLSWSRNLFGEVRIK